MQSKKISKKTKRRIFLISIVAIGLISAIAANMFSVWSQMLEIKKENKKYTLELVALKDKEKGLNLEVEKLKDPDYVAKYAREQYLYSKDGELNIIMPNY